MRGVSRSLGGDDGILHHTQRDWAAKLGHLAERRFFFGAAGRLALASGRGGRLRLLLLVEAGLRGGRRVQASQALSVEVEGGSRRARKCATTEGESHRAAWSPARTFSAS